MGKIVIVIVLGVVCSVVLLLVLMPPQVTQGSGSNVADIVAAGRSESGANDSRNVVLAKHLQSVRSKIQLWTFEHLDLLPGNTPGVSMPEQLTSKTNTDGTLNPKGAFAPYLFEFPKNPFTGTNTVNTDAPDNAWTYDSVTGEFRADNAPVDY